MILVTDLQNVGMIQVSKKNIFKLVIEKHLRSGLRRLR